MQVDLEAAAGRRSRRCHAAGTAMLAAVLVAIGIASAQAATATGSGSSHQSHRSKRSPHRHRGIHRPTGRRAAHPKASTRYVGSGADYLNNTPRWLHEQDGHISFKTSATGSRILDFKGTLSFACDTESHFVAARYILVKPDGSFAYRFNFPTKNAAGEAYGREYVAIYGRFLVGGRHASISYFVDAVVPEEHVAHPYDTAKPASLGCASWVRGSARARH